MIKHNYFYILLFVFVYACDSNIISKPNNLEAKTQRIIALQELAIKRKNDSTLIYLKEVDDIINSSTNIPDTLIIENIFIKGEYFRDIKQIDSAVHYFHKTINTIKSPIVRDIELLYYRNLWHYETSRENYANVISSVNDYVERLKNYNSTDKNLFYAYNMLETTYLKLSDYDKALYYNALALKSSKGFDHNEFSGMTIISRANTLSYNPETVKESNRLFDSLQNQTNLSDDLKIQLYNNLGELNSSRLDYKSAVDNHKKALFFLKKRKERLRFNEDMVTVYLDMASTQLKWKKFDNAKKYIDSSKVYIDSLTPYAVRKFFGQVNLEYSYNKSNNFSDVYSNYEDLENIQNELHKKSIEENLVALELSNKNEKLLADRNRQQDLDNLKLRSRQQLLLIFIILSTIIGYLFFRQRKLSFAKNNLQIQQRLLRSQMNPHFTFNALNAIQNYVHNDQEKATNYLLKFSRLLRLILENSMQNYVQLEDELELLRKYMDLHLMRHPSKFTYNIILKGINEDDLIFIPPMLIQPFIENCIEHGFLGIEYQGKIEINLSLNKNNLVCIIDDNGVGLKNNMRSKNSTSTKLISDFILKMTKTKVSVLDKIQDLKKESGLQVKFLIPFKYTEND